MQLRLRARHRLNSSRPRESKPKPSDATAIASAAAEHWDLVRSRLAPIIGEDGFRVLFARSLHRARIDHAWLARQPSKPDAPFSSLKASLQSQTPERAVEGSQALATHFNELLHGLIGKELAARLIGPV